MLWCVYDYRCVVSHGPHLRHDLPRDLCTQHKTILVGGHLLSVLVLVCRAGAHPTHQAMLGQAGHCGLHKALLQLGLEGLPTALDVVKRRVAANLWRSAIMCATNTLPLAAPAGT